MSGKSYFDEIVNWKIDDLTLVIHLAIKLIYSDGIDDIQEWHVLQLLPALMEMLKSIESADKTAEWQEKLDKIDSLMQAKNHGINVAEEVLKQHFCDKNKQEALIYFLLYIAMADNVLDPKEIAFFKNHILGPFGWSQADIVDFIKKESPQLPNSDTLIKKVHTYFS